MDKQTRDRIAREVADVGPTVDTHADTDQMDSRPKWGNRRLPRVRNVIKKIQPQLEAIRERAMLLTEPNELHLRDTILMRLVVFETVNNQAQLDRAMKSLEALLGVAAEKKVVEIHEKKQDLDSKEAVMAEIRRLHQDQGEQAS